VTRERLEVPEVSPPLNRMIIAILALLGLLVAL